MTKEQIYKKPYAQVLLRIASEDFQTLEIIHRAAGGRKENVCFIAQQVVEKCLKALLVHQGAAVPFSHSIELLISKLMPKHRPPDTDVLDALTEYATIRRYEEGYAELDEADLQAAFLAAQRTLAFAQSVIGGG